MYLFPGGEFLSVLSNGTLSMVQIFPLLKATHYVNSTYRTFYVYSGLKVLGLRTPP